MELITSRPVFNAPKSWSLTSRRRKKPPSFTVLMPDVTVKSSDTWKSAVLRPRGRSHVCPPTSMSSPAPSGGFTQGFGPAVLKKLPSASAMVVGKFTCVNDGGGGKKTSLKVCPPRTNWFAAEAPNECVHSNCACFSGCELRTLNWLLMGSEYAT